MSKRISGEKRKHLIRCAVAMQPWRIDTEDEATRMCETSARDLSFAQFRDDVRHAVRCAFVVPV
jgi:hypothetical protein